MSTATSSSSSDTSGSASRTMAASGTWPWRASSMSALFALAGQIENSGIGIAIAESRFAYPIIEGIHLIGLAVSVGLIFITDLRLMGLVLARVPLDRVL